MSNDYALFIIIVPNDFDLGTSVIPSSVSANMKARESIASSESTVSTMMPPENVVPRRSVMLPDNIVSALMAPAGIPLPIPPPINPLLERENESDLPSTQQSSTSSSICVLLKNYLIDRSDLQAVWVMSDNKKTFQITFYVEFGLLSDRMLQDLEKLSIGKRNGTQVSVLPTTIVLKGQNNEKNESLSSSLDAIDDTDAVINGELPSIKEESHETLGHDLTLSNKILKRIRESDFKKSVRARLMVHQVVASIRASSAISFDFVLLLCLASMIAAFGLMENSTVVIVASMLVSPLMNPILGVVFGLSIRDKSLWQRGLRNEMIGLIICIGCGFFLGAFTTFFETAWRSSSSFPTSEMRSRGDIRRLWVGILIALPSGAGVALSVLGGNTGSLVGVAISASLLPPAVNCGLLFAYTLLGKIFSSVAATQPSPSNSTDTDLPSFVNCTKYVNNDYEPLYTCNLSTEAAILACCSLVLTIVNIICIVIMALIILRIKEVVPLNQANEDITNFFHHHVKVARDYNKTIQAADFNGGNLTAISLRGNHLAQSIVNRWKTLKSSVSQEPQQQQQQQQSSTSSHTDLERANHLDQLFSNDIASQRKIFRLKNFAKEYNLDILNKDDYNMTSSGSQEKVHLLINDLIDMCQEIPSVFIDLYRLQPSDAQSSVDKEHLLVYQEMIEFLPPKWYQLFKYEQQRRLITPWPTTFTRSYSTRLRPLPTYNNTVSEPNAHRFYESLKRQDKKNRSRLFRQNSVPTSDHQSTITAKNAEIPVQGTRFRISKPTITEIQADEFESI